MRNSEILLVEDNAADVRLTQEILRKSAPACHLSVARDGEQAMRMLRREGDFHDQPVPDLILLDLNLPVLDGLEVLERLKAGPGLARIPVIVLSAYESISAAQRSLEAGAHAFVEKTTRSEVLLGTIAAVLGGA